jgi:signal transduction histidine kinase/PAS domain-containing protein
MSQSDFPQDGHETRDELGRLATRAGRVGVAGEADRLLEELRLLRQQTQRERDLLRSTRDALQAEQERLRQAFAYSPDGYLLTDREGVILAGNQAAATLLGLRDDLLTGQPVAQLVDERDWATLAARLAGVTDSAPLECEFGTGAATRPSRRLMATVGIAVEGGAVVGLRWLLRDSSPDAGGGEKRQLLLERAGRAHAEAAERRHAFLSEVSVILAGSLDYESTIASVTHLAVPRIADWCIAHVVEDDGSVRQLGIAHIDPSVEARLRGALERRPAERATMAGPVGRALRTGEVEVLPDLPEAEAHALSEPLNGPGLPDLIVPRSLMVVPLRIRERVLGTLSFGWSETGKYNPDDLWLARNMADRAAAAIENARLHRQATLASEAKSNFVAAMSHEFRTPLTAILAFADMLVAGIPEPIAGAPLRHAERIVGAAKHLAALIDQVLALSRIESGRERLEIEPVDLPALIRDTAALVDPLARQKGLSLVVEVSEQSAVITSDPKKLRQVLFNLLGNAVKFTDAGEVRVGLQSRDERVIIEVRDTGAGIPPEHLERIWEPFWRAVHPGAPQPSGTGLGLGIVQRLVRLLGGEIRASSEPGRGTTFAVDLPAAISSH